MPAVSPPHADTGAFRHEALLYAGDDDFVAATSAFLRDAVAAEEPTLVVVNARKIDRLRESLDGDAEAILFADMASVGANPVRIIPAWRDFVERHAPAGRRLRGIGEPIWAERGPAELVECQRHESLLNVAFAGATAFWLVCPYDVDALPHDVLAEAQRSHAFVSRGGESRQSDVYRGLESSGGPFDALLPEPPPDAAALVFDRANLAAARSFVHRHGERAGIPAGRLGDFVLAVDEVAANSIRHGGGGGGVLLLWDDDESLICEIRDDGRIHEPLAGRVRPSPEQDGGWGLWIVSQLCDLVQLRTFADGGVVRLHMRRPTG